MDFFEKLGKKVTETYKVASEKTNKAAAETKIRMKMSDNKSKINDIYKEIGKKVYEKFALDGNLDIKEDIENELNRIKELSEEIVELEKQILDLADKKECINCKAKLEKKAKFCPECGTEQPEIVEEVKEAEVVEEPHEEVTEVVEEVNEAVENVEEKIEEGWTRPEETIPAEEPQETATEVRPDNDEVVKEIVEESPNDPKE